MILIPDIVKTLPVKPKLIKVTFEGKKKNTYFSLSKNYEECISLLLFYQNSNKFDVYIEESSHISKGEDAKEEKKISLNPISFSSQVLCHMT